MKKTGQTRLLQLDHLRLLALIMMFGSHSVKTTLEITHDLRFPKLPLLSFFLQTEPLSSALFLFVSGWCLGLAQRPFKKTAFRGLSLIVLGQLLFLYQNQRLAQPFTGSGILELIGWLWLLAPLWQRITSPLLLTFLAGLPTLIAFLTTSLPLGQLNRGPFPFFPHMTYFLAGLLVTKQPRWKPAPWLQKILLLFFLTLNLTLIKLGVFNWRFSFEGYWQPRPALIANCLLIIFFLEKIAKKIKITLFPKIAQNSLIVYLSHLVFLQEIKGSLASLSLTQTHLWGLLFGGCFLVSWGAARCLTLGKLPKKLSLLRA